MATRASSTLGSRLVLSMFYDILCKLRSGKTPSNVREAERQVDVMLAATSSMHNLEYEPVELRECINSMILLVDQDYDAVVLLQKMLRLLENFASDDSLKHHMIQCKLLGKLYNKLNIWRSKSHTDTTLIQVLNLLCKLTDQVVVKCPNGVAEDIIAYTLSIIKTGSCDEVAVLCMEVLANMCRYSVSVRAHIKGQQSIKMVQKSLIGYLSQGQLAIIVTSLHILASLSLYDHLGESLFNSNNVDQTFQVAFSVILKSPTYQPRARAVDLLVDIVQCERIQKSLYQYRTLSQFINSIISLLPSADGETYLKLMELLVAFMQVKGVRGTLCKLLLKVDDTTKPTQPNLPFNSAVEWACNRSQYPKTTLAALDFLSELFQAAILWVERLTCSYKSLELLTQNYREDADLNSMLYALLICYLLHTLNTWFLNGEYPPVSEVIDTGLTSVCTYSAEILVQNLVRNKLHPPRYREEDRHATFVTQRALKLLTVCLTLTSGTSYTGLLAHHIKAPFLSMLLQGQLLHNPIVTGYEKETPCDWMLTGLEVFLTSAVLGIKLKPHSGDLKEAVRKAVTDDRATKLIAKALTIQDRKCVQNALLIIKEGCQYPEFQLQSLADYIAAANHRLDEPKEQSQPQIQDSSVTSQTSASQFSAAQISQFSHDHNAAAEVSVPQKAVPVDTTDVDALLEKFKSEVELKDAKSSEIMQIYEYKLQASATKESHLQDLLEAKALALSQADRLIAQYRGRRAQADAECLKLRSMLQESERKCEELKEKLTEVTTNSDTNLEKLKILDDENKVLKKVMEEKQKLTKALKGQTAELEQCQTSLTACTEENKKLLDINQKLRKQTSTVKLQHDHVMSELEKLEKERQKLLQVIADKEKQVLELQSSISKFSQQCDQHVQYKASLEEKMEALDSQLSFLQKSNNHLTEEVARLEKSCQSLEQQLLRSNQIIQHQKNALDQHTQMVTRIHELTSNPSRTSLEDIDS